ncbi:MAG: Tat pathway signal protein [Candidatus Sumerlaeota bacterium]|nr:Tat pathway signal protein [Candidatus Sumerlaeota bacterium]
MIFANLIHLSYNMWEDRQAPPEAKKNRYHHYMREMRFDDSLWNDIVARMAGAGMNRVVIDVGDGVQFRGRPEIAVPGAWTGERLTEELKRLRDRGLEPIPKLNFSTCHDAWLGDYARRVSTPEYYAACRDLIAETAELFGGPRFFHLGMDEETAAHQRFHAYVVVRQYELWWNDLEFYFREVEKAGARPWVWSDYLWHNRDLFLERMPKSVLQSNWYYGKEFPDDRAPVKAYGDLEAHGFDQVPTCSNHSCRENTPLTVDYCRRRIAPERLLGFLQTVWRPTKEEFRDRHMEAIDLVGQAIAAMS